MSNKYDTYESYYTEVQKTVKRYFKYAQEGAEEIRSPHFDPDRHDDVPDWAICEAAILNHELIQYYKRCVIYHCENGFFNEGGARYFNEPEDQSDAIRQLAKSGLYNDMMEVLRFIQENRDDLGEMVAMVEGPILGKGAELRYTYEKGLSDPEELEYTFVCLGEDTYRVLDPEGEPFENISPRVAVGNSEQMIPEFALKLFLDNICAKREREREKNRLNE